MLLLYILLVAFGCQQTTVNGQQTPFLESENLKTSESEKSCEPRAMSNEPFLESENLKNSESEKVLKIFQVFNFSDSQIQKDSQVFNFSDSQIQKDSQVFNFSDSQIQKDSQVFSFSVSQILYFENQIRLADSLYKNYLPQYNFEEVKAAVMFFDSLRLTTDLLESENLKTSESEKGCEPRAMSHETFLESEKSVNISEICGNEKTNHKLVQKKSEKGCEQRAMSNEPFLESENLKNSESEKSCEPRTMSNEPFSETEKSVNISEICGNEKTNHKLVQKKSEKGSEPRAMSHEQRFHNTQSSQHEAQSLKKTVDCCPLSVDIEYQRARAHYYHAVGLTERDDIVGACEHYFIALEIMESETENLKTSKSEKRLKIKDKRLKVSVTEPVEAPNDGVVPSTSSGTTTTRTVDRCLLSVDNPEDYEKIRFLSLIYTRLGELFLSENYCDLAISKYRKALKYKLLLGENKAVANTYKCLGNSYQLYNMPDSALYYYNKSLETNSELPNRLDVEKCIAQILFDKGEKDSAYIMIKNNLDKIENVNIIYSYYNILGDMYINDKEYDCAIYYLDKSMNSTISDIRVYAAIRLSSIYNIIGDNIKKAYYDNIVSKILIDYNNSNIETSKLQYIYDRYKERKSEKEKSISRMRTKVIAVSLSVLVFITFVITILILRKSKRKDKYIASKEEIISNTNEKIKQKESEIKKLIEAIERYRTDINSIKNEVVIKEHEISSKESVIKNMEDDLSAKEGELKKLQENIHEYMILINNLNEDNIAKKKQIKSHLEEIENNRQVINDKDRLISIATEGLITRKDAIAENRNEIARLQAIIGENDKIINRMSKDYKTNEELIAIQTEKIEKLKTEINETRNNLDDLRFRNSSTEGRIKSLNAELKKKEELIKKFTAEISNLRYRLERNHIEISNLNNYLQSEVCTRILKEIKELSENNMDTSELTTMSQKELVLLLNSANFHLNYFMNDIANKYSRLKKEDLYYLCLVIIGLNNSQISSLLGVTYTAVRKRKNKICKLLGLDIKENLYNHLLNLI